MNFGGCASDDTDKQNQQQDWQCNHYCRSGHKSEKHYGENFQESFHRQRWSVYGALAEKVCYDTDKEGQDNKAEAEQTGTDYNSYHRFYPFGNFGDLHLLSLLS